jgi:hypothetical protein
MNSRLIIPALIAASVIGFSHAANAGGLFGPGGLLDMNLGQTTKCFPSPQIFPDIRRLPYEPTSSPPIMRLPYLSH